MEKDIRRPQTTSDYPFTGYINKVPNEAFMKVLMNQYEQTPQLMLSWSEDQWNLRYAIDKWSLKEVILHIIDTERIFAYRALRFSRNDQTPLAGFEQDEYIPFLDIQHRNPHSLIEEYKDTRKATITMFKYFSDEMMLRQGHAAGNPLTPLTIGFIIAGHEIHHLEIIQERYL
ncbi:MAG: DinB family protein [Saprospiraceae bacterium]|nr:DinB family protein [Saprospiraceae bacterium]